MKGSDSALAIERLATLKTSSDCVTYFQRIPSGDGRDLRLSIYGSAVTREIFLELTDDVSTRVRFFPTRLKSEIRRGDIPLVDMCDAFTLARQMARRWPKTRKPPRSREKELHG